MKKALRNKIKEQKRQVPEEELAFLSEKISERIYSDEMVEKSQFIMAYCSLPDEVESMRLIDRLYRRGKTILLPVVMGDDMVLRRYAGRESMNRGAFNIWEPAGEEFVDYDKIEMALVPGVAFDRSGHRLGRGKGYYDRFLPMIPQAEKVGVCFGFQMVSEVPCESFDIVMDRVITEI